ncbi:transglutaminase-like domain-containing protein [Nocardia sp. NPDC051570]|uniref:transglutaminase-like domain-containing protein n=1 Tax=Nocardia sp. NPDC051570 TaxID=3364324 RepID=UPI0037AD118D
MMSYATQSRFTDPRDMAWWLGDVSAEIADIHAAAAGLVFHYRANGNLARHGFGAERVHEIDLRYADSLLTRLRELNPAPPGQARARTDRVVGCCRDFTVLFIAMARQRGIPVRARVGFATYLLPGWALDHEVAEVWDDGESRWRLVDPQLVEHDEFDVLDVPRDAFLTGPRAWLECRSEARDAGRFVVSPDDPLPMLRSWPQLRHNLVQDLAALNKYEMILWDVWGLLEETPIISDEQAAKLDALAELLGSVDIATDRIENAFTDAALNVPEVVTTFSPAEPVPTRIRLRPV